MPDEQPQAPQPPEGGTPSSPSAASDGSTSRPPAPPLFGTCRVCGCTEFTPCLDAQQNACFWVEPDLCSGCAPKEKLFAVAALSEAILQWEEANGEEIGPELGALVALFFGRGFAAGLACGQAAPVAPEQQKPSSRIILPWS